MFTSIKLIFILLFLASPAWATTYYVDYTNGNNSNLGTSGSPFKTMAAVSGTNFLKPGDHVEILGNNTFIGNDCFLTINSSGTAANPIVVEGNGSPDPVFDCATAATSISGWSGWTNTTGSIWENNTTIPFTVDGMIVDGTYNVIGTTSSHSADLTNLSNRFYVTGGNVFVRLLDSTDPDGHTIEFTGLSEPNASSTTGSVAATGNYITFNHIKVYGASGSGFLINTNHITLNNDTAIFTGYATLYCASHAYTPGCNYMVSNNFNGQYANGSPARGANGENVVIEGSYNIFNNGIVENGSMAGIDVISYASDTPGSYNYVLNSTFQNNSLRSMQNDSSGFDPQTYCDGCTYTYFINNIIQGNKANAQYTSGQNAVNGMSVSTENFSTGHIPHDVYFINNQTTQDTYQGISIANAGHTDIYNIWVIGNTFAEPENSFSGIATFNNFDITDYGTSLHVRNNIFYAAQNAASIYTDSMSMWDSDYNQIYNTGTNSFKIGSTNYSLATWQSDTSQESHSAFGDPKFVTYSTDLHLQRTASGQANNSPSIGKGLGGYAQQYFYPYSLGTTDTKGIIDKVNIPDIGYHYNMVVGSLYGWANGTGTTYTGATYSNEVFQ